jgi:hypothetical protein
VVLHRCDNRVCVRPDHLFLGTNGENNRDAVKKGRSARGERAWTAKLTAEIVLELRGLYDRGMLNQSGAARQYGMSVSTINQIVRRKAWTHLP